MEIEVLPSLRVSTAAGYEVAPRASQVVEPVASLGHLWDVVGGPRWDHLGGEAQPVRRVCRRRQRSVHRYPRPNARGVPGAVCLLPARVRAVLRMMSSTPNGATAFCPLALSPPHRLHSRHGSSAMSVIVGQCNTARCVAHHAPRLMWCVWGDRPNVYAYVGTCAAQIDASTPVGRARRFGGDDQTLAAQAPSFRAGRSHLSD